MTKQVKIDRDKVQVPKLTFTQKADDQLALIIENDFTLAGRYFRLLISGKGCDGFTYSTGFTDLNDEDFMIQIGGDPKKPQVVMDPFTAFYLSNVTVDYVQDFSHNVEGFVVTNHDQDKFNGKFWKSAPEAVPPLKEK